MVQFISQRRVTSAAVLITALLLLHTFTISHPQTEWMDRTYDVTTQTLQLIYGVALVILMGVMVFEPPIRRELRQTGAAPLIIALAMVASVLCMRFLIDDQSRRFMLAVPPISFLMAYVVLLGVLGILLVIEQPLSSPTQRMKWYALGVLLLVGAILLTLHIISVGRFARLNDVYDEVWAASSMANYVYNGDFSPSLGASPYGSPDPFFSRWLLYNGMWAKLWGSTDFVTLRSFPLVAGLLLVVITGVILWREPSLSWLARIAGIVFLLSMSVFGRTSHNLRMDIGLGIFGALVLLFLLEYFRKPDQGVRWLFLAGISLYLGLETIPTTAFVFSFVVGVMVVINSLRRPIASTRWTHILIYALGCAVACFGYIYAHLFPDFETQWQNFQLARERYFAIGSAGVSSPLQSFETGHLFSLLLSPVEPFAIYAALIGLALVGKRHERLLLGVVGVALYLTYANIGGSYGYHMMYGAFVAYAVARIFSSRLVVILGAFVIIPAVAAPVTYDMYSEYRQNLNGRLISELDLLTWQVPEGATVVGDDLFWITLHTRANFIGHSAIQHYRGAKGITDEEVLSSLDADMVICIEEYAASLCDLAEAYFESEPTVFQITDRTYLVFKKEPLSG